MIDNKLQEQIWIDLTLDWSCIIIKNNEWTKTLTLKEKINMFESLRDKKQLNYYIDSMKKSIETRDTFLKNN